MKRLFAQAVEGEYVVNETNEQLHEFLKETTLKRINNSKVNAALMRQLQTENRETASYLKQVEQRDWDRANPKQATLEKKA